MFILIFNIVFTCKNCYQSIKYGQIYIFSVCIIRFPFHTATHIRKVQNDTELIQTNKLRNIEENKNQRVFLSVLFSVVVYMLLLVWHHTITCNEKLWVCGLNIFSFARVHTSIDGTYRFEVLCHLKDFVPLVFF